MTFAEQFQNIKKKTEGADSASLPHDLAAQINLTDEDCGGIFYIANIGGKFAVEPYDYHDHTVMLTANSNDLIKIIDGKTDAADAYFRGILNIDGNIDHALELAKALKPSEKKPVKKNASKKSSTKKTSDKKATDKTTVKKKAVSEKKAVAEKKTDAKKTTKNKTAAKKTAEKKSAKK